MYSADASPSPAGLARFLPVGIFILLLAVEFYGFDQIGARQHTQVYPRWNDQIQYLTEAYLAHEHARNEGLISAIRMTLTNPSAQGTLHDVYAVVTFALFGPSRSAALALNMVALMIWQVALFATLRKLRGSAWVGLLAALLPLALAGPWRSSPGSAYDFRLDHLLMCTLGVTSCMALLTDGFRSRGWSIGFGIAVGITLLTRFLSGTYFVAIFAAFLCWSLFGPDRRRRTFNVLVAACAAFVLASPIFWINRDWIWNYYWIGHYVGPESAIRSQNFGLFQSVEFVSRALYQEHVGTFFVVVAIIATIVVLRLRQATHFAGRCHLPIVGAIFLAAPALILTLHAQKSSVVVGALVPGLFLLLLGVWTRWLGQGTRARVLPLIVTSMAFLCVVHFLRVQAAPIFDPSSEAELRHVSRFGEVISSRAYAAGVTSPRVAVDQVTDALDGQILRVTTYERTGKWVPFEMMLPTGIAEPTEEDVMDRLKLSDFVFVTTAAPQANYPYDRKLAALSPKVLAWCAAELVEVERFSLYGSQFVLYERPSTPRVAAGEP